MFYRFLQTRSPKRIRALLLMLDDTRLNGSAGSCPSSFRAAKLSGSSSAMLRVLEAVLKELLLICRCSVTWSGCSRKMPSLLEISVPSNRSQRESGSVAGWFSRLQRTVWTNLLGHLRFGRRYEETLVINRINWSVTEDGDQWAGSGSSFPRKVNEVEGLSFSVWQVVCKASRIKQNFGGCPLQVGFVENRSDACVHGKCGRGEEGCWTLWSVGS